MASSTRALLAPSAVMATGTITSRVTGIARDIAMAAALGFYLVSDAFSLGNSLPTILYILVVGGALNAVFIPQLVRRMREDADQGKAYADALLTVATTILLVLSIAAVIAAPWIVDLYTPADYPRAEYELAVAFARLCLPQIFFYGLYSMLSQVLNARGRFGAPMFAPIANNVIAIATFLLFIAVAGTSAAADGVLTTDQILILGIGTTIGVVLQALILIPLLSRAGYLWRPSFAWRTQGLGHAAELAAWTVGLVLVNQIAYLVITRFATQANVDASAAGVVAAGLTTYQKAHLVFMLPHSVITVSVVTALLPALSRVAHAGRMRQVGADVSGAMRLITAAITPIAAILAVTGPGIAILLFGYGAATPDQAAEMGRIVSIFMLGLIPFTLFYVLLRGFYALEDTRSPFVITVVFSALWLVVVSALFPSQPPGGGQIAVIAFGYVLSYWVGLILAWVWLAIRLRRRATKDDDAPGMRSPATLWSLARLTIAGVLAFVLMSLTRAALLDVLGLDTTSDRLGIALSVLVVAALGAVTYVLVAWLLRCREVGQAWSMLRRVLKRGNPAARVES
ncbi:MAG: murein biosynthesis integral membrane protein MurJ [Actinobacteria bacterium]|nr:murein biosynthesis integral membrane protein MurJ [Actinomycetota bacterium]